MSDFISDEEMSKLESAQSSDFVSDEDMAKLEASAPQQQTASTGPRPPQPVLKTDAELPQNPPTPLSAIVHGFSGGASGQFNDELANTLGDPEAVARDKASQEAYPGWHFGANVVGSGLQAAALAPYKLGMVGLGALQSGLSGLGQSEKRSIDEAVKDTALSAVIGGAFSWGLSKLFGKGGKPITKAKDGSFDINVSQNAKDVFKVSRETAESLATPEAQNALRADLAAQAGNMKNAISADFQATEALKQAGLQAKGALPSKGLGNALNEAWDSIDNLKPENNKIAVDAVEGLKQRFKDLNKQLITKSPSGNFDDVPLAELEKARGELGDIIFGKKSYNNDSQVKKAATNLWGKLTDTLIKNDIDPLTKEAGDLTKALSGQRALFLAADEIDSLPSGDWIKALANPQSGTGYERFKNMVKPLEQLSKKGYGDVVPNLSNYISNDFNSAVMRARVSNMVLGEVGAGVKLSPKQALNSIVSGYANDVASKTGSAIGSLDKLKMLRLPVGRAITAPVDAGLSALPKTVPYTAGSLGSLLGGTSDE